MALLDKVVKQRMVGALVLVALAVIFLPMLFSREDEMRQVRVDAPEAPAAPTMAPVQVEPVAVPEPQVLPEEAPVVVDESTAPAQAPSAPITAVVPTAVPVTPPTPAPVPAPTVASKPVTPAPAAVKPEAKPAATVATAAKPAAGKIDANGLPVSWSVQLASLSSRAGADNLQKTLRSQGYNAYIRSAGGMNRVYVGPLIERAEAERLRDVISRQQKLNGIIVRFQPERS
ncbi:cell division protein [Pseudomonas alkylphenolica]|uniref:Cell division protein n=1 Tax=Pseudomonas alkylphenolica TaxID=237609 RepID=A0A443ZGQ6_9PSED|nr:SPOR domain-containing protein [Pseudomonas alkylphenolica]RWU17933.1 cell division protein [Pseudomonas alkylphenolica]